MEFKEADFRIKTLVGSSCDKHKRQIVIRVHKEKSDFGQNVVHKKVTYDISRNK
jgi:hypothetical protein